MPTAHQDSEYLDRRKETMSEEERRPILNDLLGRTLELAFLNSRAYGEIYGQAGVQPGDVKDIDDLSRLPLLRMSDLVERQNQNPPFGGFETVPPDRFQRVYVNPGLIYQPGGWEDEDTSWAEAMCGAGFKRGDRLINTFNYHLWPFAFMLDESAKMIGASLVPAGAGNILMQVRILQTLEIKGFLGTPSFLMSLAQRAEGLGLEVRRDLALEAAMVGAEMLPESLRQRLEDKLGITIRQCYGTVFLGCLGYECRHATGLHVPENVIVEIVDPVTGRPVPEGVTGEIVATRFNPAYPMIRLATGDLSLFSREQCPCGRTGPMLKKVLGRVDQATKVGSTFVHPWQADELMARYPEAFKYQVVVTRDRDVDRMTFHVEIDEGQSDPDRIQRRIERDIEEVLGVKGEVKAVPRGTIPDFHKKIDDRRQWD
ncbi:MAG: AMP-binding protein [Proteobacteria bacterium]|nr:AMP-binding protein [Pseudomonadota bacterium]